MREVERILASTIMGWLLAASIASAQSQPHYLYQSGSTLMQNTWDAGPQVILERQTLVHPDSTMYEVVLPRRSDYAKRLEDILSQINMAHDKGWLSDEQFTDLKKWQNTLVRENLGLRQMDNGTVSEKDAAMLERHVTGLAYTINKYIDDGSRKVGVTRGGL